MEDHTDGRSHRWKITQMEDHTDGRSQREDHRGKITEGRSQMEKI
jgi:hypothetical protein